MSRTKTNLKIKISRQPLPWTQILVELKFLELKLHGKLEFEELEFLNSGRSLYILETVVDCNIFWQIVVFGQFGLQTWL